VVVAHLGAVVELDAHEHEREPADVAKRREQRPPPLLEQLVVDGLVEVAEHVHVAPPQGDTRRRRRAQAGTCASIAAAERSTSSSVVAQLETEMRSARRPRHSVALAQHVPSCWMPAVTASVAASSSANRTRTWLKTTSLSTSARGSDPRISANCAARSQR